MKSLSDYIIEKKSAMQYVADIDYTSNVDDEGVVKNAIDIIRNLMNSGDRCEGPEWVSPTARLETILQSYVKKHKGEYKAEYEWIHKKATNNWHMYEDE